MNTKEHKQKLEEWLNMADPIGRVKELQLSEVLYAFEENGLFPDNVDSISREQVMLCWKIVQRVRLSQFPDELRM